MSAAAYTVELTSLGFQVREPGGGFYNGIWHARRIAELACGSLNEVGRLGQGQKPDRLLDLTRVDG